MHHVCLLLLLLLFACMYVCHHLCAKRALGSLELDLQTVVSCCSDCCESNPGLLQEQQVLFFF